MAFIVKEHRPGFVDSTDPIRSTVVEAIEAALGVPWLVAMGADRIDGSGERHYVYAGGFVVATVVAEQEV